MLYIKTLCKIILLGTILSLSAYGSEKIKIIVYENYENTSKIKLPYEFVMKKIVSYRNAELTEGNDYNYRIIIDSKAGAVGVDYPPLGVFYSGAYVNGSITVNTLKKQMLSMEFSGEVEPKKVLVMDLNIPPPLVPDRAPFAEAYWTKKTSFGPKIMEAAARIWGNEFLLKMYSDTDIRIKTAIVNGFKLMDKNGRSYLIKASGEGKYTKAAKEILNKIK